MTRIAHPRFSFVALSALSCLMLISATAAAAVLHADITNLADGGSVSTNFTVRGVAYNSETEGAFVDGGLRAFYRTPTSSDPFGAGEPLPSEPAAGELFFGRNSEFTPNPINDNWWIADTQQFRTDNGIANPAGATNQKLPAYQMRKVFGQLADEGDDNWGNGFAEQFGIRMEGKLVVPAGGVNHTFGGAADDLLTIHVNGRRVYHNAFPDEAATVNLAEGEHGFVLEFGEGGGSQWYSASLPAGVTFKANAEDEHTFAGRTLEYGKTYAERRNGMWTMQILGNIDGSGGPLQDLSYYKNRSTGNWGSDYGPSPQADNYRSILAGYWYCPADGNYAFSSGGADDRIALAVSDDENANPWTIPFIAADDEDPDLPQNTDLIAMTEGWKPVRIEFGEGGGGARWAVSWMPEGGGFQSFGVDEIQSTEDEVFDWTLLAAVGDQVASEDDLFEVTFDEALIGQTIDLRLRAVDTNHQVAEEIIEGVTIVPEPATLTLLTVSAMSLGRVRRQS